MVMFEEVSGRPVASGGWLDGKRDGYWEYYEDGWVELTSEYRNGLSDGISRRYGRGGELIDTASTRDGKLHGQCTFGVDENGQSNGITGFYEGGKLVNKSLNHPEPAVR